MAKEPVTCDVVKVSIRHRRKGKRVLALIFVDASDADIIANYKLSLGSNGYVIAALPGERHGVYLHRLLMGISKGDIRQVDHINCDRLDYRKTNLRVVTQKVNKQNHPGWKNASSRFRNVSWSSKAGKWQVYIWLDGKNNFFGLFDNEIEAAKHASAVRLARMEGAVS